MARLHDKYLTSYETAKLFSRMAVPFYIPTCSLKEYTVYNSIYVIFSERQTIMMDNRSVVHGLRWERVSLQRESTVLRVYATKFRTKSNIGQLCPA